MLDAVPPECNPHPGHAMTDARLFQQMTSVHASGLRTTGTGLKGMPLFLLEQTSKRLAIVGMCCAVLWLCARIVYSLGVRLSAEDCMVERHLWWVGFGVSLGIVALSRLSKWHPITLLKVGIAYEIFIALLIAVTNHASPEVSIHPLMGRLPAHGLSWVAVWVLLYGALIPSTPRMVLTAGLVAVSMDPLVYGMAGWLSHDHPGLWFDLTGLSEPSPVDWRMAAMLYSFSYLLALIATIPSKIISRLGKQVKRARLMGSYQLTRKLGTGGMGEVWKADHRMLARPAAVKIVRPELLGAESEHDALQTLKRFEREAQATALLHSPHTVQLYDFGLTPDGTFYYVMELLEGIDLEKLVRHFGPLEPARAVHLLRQVCHSLEDAHRAGLMHRDIKPANIFACRMGQDHDFVKVLDFGLVRHHRSDGRDLTVLTQESITSGTPAYMAPESALGEKGITGAVDLYALGCVGYWLLTGQLVFEADNPVRMAVMHVQQEPEAPSRRSELPVPPELDAVLLRCLEKEPEKRPASAAELARLLDDVPLEEPWTPERARRWWEIHHPERVLAQEREPFPEGEGTPPTLVIQKEGFESRD